MSQTLIPLRVRGASTFDQRVVESVGRVLDGQTIQVVQVNIGLRCNLACHHCHVESSPKRDEEMTWETMQLALDAARRSAASTLDITGGAPEMHPRFRDFVVAGRKQGLKVMVRTNLTILLEDGYQDLPEFFREHEVHLVASLPCYLEENVDKQRGRGVYRESIEAIRRLNAVGYGIDSRLPLDLMYNPGGASLSPRQDALEVDYKRELRNRFGIEFTRLIAIANMPIGRFQHDLQRSGKADAYMHKLQQYEQWSQEDQIALWINAYNALALLLIVEHHPIQRSAQPEGLKFPANSIWQIPGRFDKVNFPVMGREMSLDDVEHRTLRVDFDEPRIHVALVCVAITRLMPLFPFNLLNYALGLTRVRLGTYVFWSWLCMLPGTIVYVVGANALMTALTEGRVPRELIAIAAGGLIVLTVLGLIVKRRLAAKEEARHDPRGEQTRNDRVVTQ